MVEETSSSCIWRGTGIDRLQQIGNMEECDVNRNEADGSKNVTDAQEGSRRDKNVPCPTTSCGAVCSASLPHPASWPHAGTNVTRAVEF